MNEKELARNLRKIDFNAKVDKKDGYLEMANRIETKREAYLAAVNRLKKLINAGVSRTVILSQLEDDL